MIITCPNCAARFNLKDELLGEKGRNVKCAKCSHRWFAEPAAKTAAAPKSAAPKPAAPEPEPAPPPPPPPPPPTSEGTAGDDEDGDDDDTDDDDFDEAPSPPPIPSEEEIARYQTRPVRTRSLLPWWIALFVCIAGMVAAVIYFSKAIVSVYPAANKLYTAIGLPVDTLGYGLEIVSPTTSQREDGGDQVIVVSGAIRNTTNEVLDVPLLRGELKNSQGRTLFIWSFETEEPRVLPGESNEYETEIRNPPPGATDLNISFTRQEEIDAERQRAREAATRPTDSR